MSGPASVGAVQFSLKIHLGSSSVGILKKLKKNSYHLVIH
jgi:hypothetical protein